MFSFPLVISGSGMDFYSGQGDQISAACYGVCEEEKPRPYVSPKCPLCLTDCWRGGSGHHQGKELGPTG